MYFNFIEILYKVLKMRHKFWPTESINSLVYEKYKKNS